MGWKRLGALSLLRRAEISRAPATGARQASRFSARVTACNDGTVRMMTMTEVSTLLSFAPVEWRHRRVALLLGACLVLLGVARAEAATITWHWAGPVTGYSCVFGPCITTLDTIVPLGTTVDVFVSFASDFPTSPNPSLPCYLGQTSTSLQVLGRTYTNTGSVFVDGEGFGGNCATGGASYDHVEIVVPNWALTNPPIGPALPNGWVPFSGGGLDGLWWGGDLTSVQPTSINTQFPAFNRPLQDAPQRFTANLQAVPVPEPATWLLLATGLSAAAWRRRGQ